MRQHPLLDSQNYCKKALKEGEISVGVFLVSASPLIAECCATRSIDWLMIDQEASPAGRKEMTQILQALNGSKVTGLVRVATNQQQLIEAALDAGARGVLVPKVNTREEAEAVVQSAHYPPVGKRGLNPIRCSGYFSGLADYLAAAKQETLVLVQIETSEALKHVDAIAATPGIDGLFVGCGDLAMDLGQPGDIDHPVMDEAIRAILSACHKHQKIPGIFAYSLPLAERYAKWGYRFISIGNDVKLLAACLEQQTAQFSRVTGGEQQCSGRSQKGGLTRDKVQGAD